MLKQQIVMRRKLQEVLDQIPKKDIPIVQGDWNAKVGKDACIFFVWLVCFIMSSSTTRLYRGRAPEADV